jgi:FMN-dependent dehydrogenase
MRLDNCHNFHDFRALARRKLPGPIFNYIDGAADDEATLRQNTASFERCDLVPNVLRGVGTIDMSVTVMGQKLAMPVYCSPTALQRLFHHQGERAVAAAAAKFETMFGVSSLGTVSLEELRKAYDTPQVYQFYFHRPGAQSHHDATRKKRGHQHHDVDGRQHYRRQSRARSAHRIFYPVQAYFGRNASIRDQTDVGNQLSHS